MGFFSYRRVCACACASRGRSPLYEAAKLRKGAIDALKAATPASVHVAEINIEILEVAIAEAEEVKAGELRMPNDPAFGARALKVASLKLKGARRAQSDESDTLPAVDLNDLGEVRGPDEDLAAQKEFSEERSEAERKGDDNLGARTSRGTEPH